MSVLESRAEVRKLARLLDRDESELAELEAAAPEDLAALREQVTDVLFDGDAKVLKRVADAGGLLPVKLLATIAQRAFGPLLCARLAGLMPADRAVAIAQRLPAPFLAQVAAEMDPRRATEVIAAMPRELLTATAAEMARRDETVAMGRFVGHLDDETLRACAAQLDDHHLLHVAFVLEGKDRIDRLVELLPDERLPGLAAAAERPALADEAADLRAHLGSEQLARLTGALRDSGA